MESNPASNPHSKFSPFSLTLPNDAILTGLSHSPAPAEGDGSTKSPPSRPLIIALHGGTCTAHHYDISPAYTASTTSSQTGFPFVAINRPCYATSSSFLPLKDNDSSFFQTLGHWLHHFILPTLWTRFGVPNDCTAVVLTSHSMAVPPSVITAALYADTPVASRGYPLAGMILSGFAAFEFFKLPNSDPLPDVKMVEYPVEIKRVLMLSEPEHNCADPALHPLLEKQSVGMPIEELADLRTQWPGYWTQYAGRVECAVLMCLGEFDWLWRGTDESIEAFQKEFRQCRRFDGAVIKGGCHALEWSWKADEWYEKCFEWAREVS